MRFFRAFGITCLLALSACTPRGRSRAADAGSPAAGETPDNPVKVRDMFARNQWVTDTLCGGHEVRSYDVKYAQGHDLRMHEVRVECPPGTKHHVFIEEQTAAPADTATLMRALTPEFERVIPALSSRFGIHDREELKKSIRDARGDRSRGSAWLLGWIHDLPAVARAREALLKEDPSDLESAVSLAEIRTALGDLDGTLAALATASTNAARVIDTRGMAVQPSKIPAMRCTAHFRQGKLPLAITDCQEAIQLGGKVDGNLGLARLYFAQGDIMKAYDFVKVAVPADSSSRSEWLMGLIFLQAGKTEQAMQTLKMAQKMRPSFTPTFEALEAPKRTNAEWLESEQTYDRKVASADLAHCGHIYLELDMPEPAASCFAASEKLEKGFALAERLRYDAETDPKSYVDASIRAARSNPHPAVIEAVAAILADAGRKEDAKDWLFAVFPQDPVNDRVLELAKLLCDEDVGACRAEHEQKRGHDQPPPWLAPARP